MKLGETCPGCGLIATEAVDGYIKDLAIDPCLGKLENVVHACCGHKKNKLYGEHRPYVVIAPGYPAGVSMKKVHEGAYTHLVGQEALDYFKLKKLLS